MIRLLITLVALASGLGAQTLEGLWLGTLEAGGMKLRLVLHVTRSAGGALAGTLDSLDQGTMDLPVDAVIQDGRTLSLTMKTIGATYTGAVNSDATEMAGQWKQGMALPLTFKRVNEIPGLIRPQEPKKPYPYDEEEVTFPSVSSGVQLAGTLTLPRTKGPFPAVLLITGSGAQNRDEELMGHRPFLVIADHLTRHGIAVLRVDDRGTAKSTGNFGKSTTADFAEDAQGGVNYLKTRREINGAKIGLIGHSEGAVIAPMLASRSNDIAFVVLLAGTGVPGDQVLERQQTLLQRAMRLPGSIIDQNRDIQAKLMAVARREKDPAVAERKMRAELRAVLDTMPQDQREMMEPQIQAQVKMATSPWFRYFLDYDPAAALRKVKQPVLAMNGELDLQVSPEQNLPAIAKALEEGGNPDYEIVKLPKLNHLFQTARTGLPGEYSSISETIAPIVLEIMTAWILLKVG